MRTRLPCMVASFVGVWSVFGAAASAPGQVTIQLPTFSNFSVSTTVSVPDRGGAFMGGVGRAKTGTVEFGILGLPIARATGRESGASSTWVTAFIHDFSELEPATGGDPFAESASPGGRFFSTADHVTGSLAEAKAKRHAEDLAAEQDALALLAKANAARAANKPRVALSYYKTALKKARSEALQDQIVQVILELRAETATPKKSPGYSLP